MDLNRLLFETVVKWWAWIIVVGLIVTGACWWYARRTS